MTEEGPPSPCGSCFSTSCGSERRDSGAPSRSSDTCSAISWKSAAGSHPRSTAKACRWPSSRPDLSGAALVGLAFVLPSFLMVIAIAVGYLRFGGLPWMQGAFYGIGAAFVLGRRALVDVTTVAIALGTLLVLIRVRRVPEPLVIAAAGLLGVLLKRGA